jgi:hypothetical protein
VDIAKVRCFSRDTDCLGLGEDGNWTGGNTYDIEASERDRDQRIGTISHPMASDRVDYMSTKEAASFIRRSPQWLRQSRRKKKKDYAPPHHVMGGRFVYFKNEILEWIERCKRG